MRRASILLAVVAVLACACGGTDTTTPASRETPTTARDETVDAPNASPDVVGGTAQPADLVRSEITLIDPSRPTIARPPLAGSAQRSLRISLRRPPGAGPWPLVVFGHGFGARVDTYSALLDRIAIAGFVVAAPEFPGSSSALAGKPDERDLDQEPCDLRFVADQLVRGNGNGQDGPIVSTGPVALAGQSDGATAAAFAAEVAVACPAPAIGAVIAFSARPPPPGSPRSSGAGAVLLATTGTADEVNPPAQTQALVTQWPDRAWLVTSDGDGHLAPATTSPRQVAIANLVVDVLRGSIGGDPSALDRLAADAAVPGLHLQSR